MLFKTFWKVVNKYKGTIIGYTVMLLVFGTLNMSSNDVTDDFKSPNRREPECSRTNSGLHTRNSCPLPTV